MWKVLPLLLSIGSPSAARAQCTVQEAAQHFQLPFNKFGSEVLTRISDETGSHFVASSLSLWTLLAFVTFGATDSTLEELEDVLKYYPHPCYTRKLFDFVKSVSANYDDGVMFERSTSIFGDRSLLFKDSFRKKAEATGVIKLQEISFDRQEDVAATINGYVKAATAGAIDDIVTPSLLTGAEVVMVDALCFRGPWKHRFLPQYTLVGAFHDAAGARAGDVNLLYAKLHTNVAHAPAMEARVLELPYDSERFAMIVVLPNKRVPIERVIDNLKDFDLHWIYARFKPQTVTVRIPRFQITSHNDMKHILIDMGLTRMFGVTATFTDMAEVSLYVSTIIQKATIKVTEKGESVAPARTFNSSEIETTFTADRPFLYMLVEKTTKIALLTGAYSKPSLY